MKKHLNSTDDYLKNIRTTFAWIIDNSLNCNPNGCFLVNSLIELAPHDELIRKRVKDHISNVELAFKQALIDGKKQGQLAEGKDIEVMVKKIMVNIWGINVIQRTGLSIEEVESYKSYYRDIV